MAFNRYSGRGRTGEHRQAGRALRTILVAALVALAAAGAAFAKGDNPWAIAQKSLHYPVYKPSVKVDLQLVGFKIQPCGAGKDGSIFASYGRGSAPKAFGRLRGFMIGEASPAQCSDFGGARPVGKRKVNGVLADVFAYCAPTATTCAFAAGVTKGYVVRWLQPAPKTGALRKRTLITLITSRLTFAEVLKIAKGLTQVG